MGNKVRVNKKTGEVFIYSPESIEQRAIIIKKVEGIVSFPIKVEEIEGNKAKKTVYGLYYEDSLMNDFVLILTYEKRDDAITMRQDIEKAYLKSTKNNISCWLKVIAGIAIILITGKYIFGNNHQSEELYNSKDSVQSLSNPAGNSNYNRDEIMKTVEDFKNKQKNTLQESKDNDTIKTQSVSENPDKQKEVKQETAGQQFVDLLNTGK